MQNKMDTITVTLENGEKLPAPVGIWLAAMLGEMKASDQLAIRELEQRIVARVDKICQEAKAKTIVTPQSESWPRKESRPGHHVLHADGLHLGAEIGSDKPKPTNNKRLHS